MNRLRVLEDTKLGTPDRGIPSIVRQEVSESELENRWGVKVSCRTINLLNITVEEAIHIQRYPMLNGPDPALTRRLWRKLTNPNHWRIVVREPQQLSIEVHSIGPAEDAQESGAELLARFSARSKFDLWSVLLLPESAHRVLIGGSMEGNEPMMMRTLWPDREYYTLDILCENAAVLKHRSFFASVADIHRMPYASETFDAVYNNNVMEHLYNDIDECFREIFDVLRPGGVFYFVVPTEMNSTSPDADLQVRYAGHSYNWWLVDPSHPWKTDLHDIQTRLLAAGFEQPTFAYYEEHLQQCAAKSRRGHSAGGTSWLKRIFEAFEGSLLIQQIESRIREATGFYKYRGFRRRLRDLLGLPDRQMETLQVAVLAAKPQSMSFR
ncbi:MAG: methyltransferase domain-containing protein [Acidobacteria bacterium]|nr:methyltransferase domain-containing protein [Acidobacteriota bacterium]